MRPGCRGDCGSPPCPHGEGLGEEEEHQSPTPVVAEADRSPLTVARLELAAPGHPPRASTPPERSIWHETGRRAPRQRYSRRSVEAQDCPGDPVRHRRGDQPAGPSPGGARTPVRTRSSRGAPRARPAGGRRRRGRGEEQAASPPERALERRLEVAPGTASPRSARPRRRSAPRGDAEKRNRRPPCTVSRPSRLATSISEKDAAAGDPADHTPDEVGAEAVRAPAELSEGSPPPDQQPEPDDAAEGGRAGREERAEGPPVDDLESTRPVTRRGGGSRRPGSSPAARPGAARARAGRRYPAASGGARAFLGGGRGRGIGATLHVRARRRRAGPVRAPA